MPLVRPARVLRRVLLLSLLSCFAACHHSGAVLTGDQGVAGDLGGATDGGACFAAGANCAVGTDCCTLDCNAGHVCSSTQCISDGQSCTAGGAACCSATCASGTCKPLNTTCKTAGNACPNGNADCCSQLCIDGTCAAPSVVSYCNQTGDICYHDADCCTGACDGATTGSPGTCANITAGCNVDGLSCSGCGGCCSSFCAPYGTAGSKVCQAASGCHVLGDLCHVDTDCCGGAVTTGLPGAGLVKCNLDPTHPQIGTCGAANPNNCPNGEATCKNTCQPEGDVCHFLGNGGCSSNSFPANCCGAPGSSKGVCNLDPVGVPRCYGLTACVTQGASCASAADCCDSMPCLPGANGALTCSAVSCQPSGSVCTTTADCCTGAGCVVPAGSVLGMCSSTVTQPPTDMGGSTDMSTALCALYGQHCSTTVTCCSNVACARSATSGGGACDSASYTDCVCYSPIL